MTSLPQDILKALGIDTHDLTKAVITIEAGKGVEVALTRQIFKVSNPAIKSLETKRYDLIPKWDEVGTAPQAGVVEITTSTFSTGIAPLDLQDPVARLPVRVTLKGGQTAIGSVPTYKRKHPCAYAGFVAPLNNPERCACRQCDDQFESISDEAERLLKVHGEG